MYIREGIRYNVTVRFAKRKLFFSVNVTDLKA